MATKNLELLEERGPLPGEKPTFGVAHDGQQLWVATGSSLQRLSPATGVAERELEVSCDAGTAFDGTHLWQVRGDRIHKLDAETGEVLHDIAAPGGGKDSGLAWAEGALWVGQYRDRKIHQIDPKSGEVLRTLESNRFVTGVTWVEGELWHGTWEHDESELRRIDPNTGNILSQHAAPAGMCLTGLAGDEERLFCGSGDSGKIRVFRRPR